MTKLEKKDREDLLGQCLFTNSPPSPVSPVQEGEFGISGFECISPETSAFL
jgi:hypothetical protein